MNRKRPKTTLKQKLIVQFMTQGGLNAVAAAHAADKFIERVKKSKNN